jgi:protein-glucosylgalactosylhydroxylysine glucosidase
MINRYELITRHNPVYRDICYEAPLSVGNGEIAFTCDVTGMQTFYTEQKLKDVPLCTMSQWGWHVTPASEERYAYTLDDLIMTEYDNNGRKVKYAVEEKSGNEQVYHWLRQNPHRLNLGRIGFTWEGREIKSEEVELIYQELKLYEGIIESSFSIKGISCKVYTACHGQKDALGFLVESAALKTGRLKVCLFFPYGSADISASDWENTQKHETNILETTMQGFTMERSLNKNQYYVTVNSEEKIKLNINKIHTLEVETDEESLSFSVLFEQNNSHREIKVGEIFDSSKKAWSDFWNQGAMVDLHRSKDTRALELERRIILSQYLLAIQSGGSLPPQETGLTCNSWYGKFHLEMHLWHSAHFPLWNRPLLLERSFPWYKKHLPEAKENALRNGYKGARWPKMIGPEGIDSPSIIAPLLIWQQPHIIYMLELVYHSGKDGSFLKEYWEIIKETADFMCDFAVYEKETGTYHLYPPIIPAQEEHNPAFTKNPLFEVEYWKFTLNIAVLWAERLGFIADEWSEVSDNMADLPSKDLRYLAHENCPDTFVKFNKDHPSMLGAFGLIASERVSTEIMDNTLKTVLKDWDYSSMWGWDFAMMAMTAIRLHKPELAIDILLMDTHKNYYAGSGNNYQLLRQDLPLYLPGNGSLLLAVTMMTAGYKGCSEELPGFPKNGLWEVEYEDMNPFPY